MDAALLIETESSLRLRHELDEYAQLETSLTSVLQTVKAHVLEFEHLVQ